MRSFIVLAALAALAATVSAECANACSGHGTCSASDQCDCFPNYRAADCSERVCPYGFAWVDSPRGDLNHDGVISFGTSSEPINAYKKVVQYEYEAFPNDASTGKVALTNEGHFYSECSNKGLCDRTTAECACFEGYTGSSCQRTTCPNDCSGHGVCRTVEEIAAGALTGRKVDSAGQDNYWEGVTVKSQYRLWDMDMAQSCVCDPGYTSADCSKRQCPRGDDPLTHRASECGGFACRTEVQTLQFTTAAATADYISLQYEDWTGKEWETESFWYSGGLAGCPSASLRTTGPTGTCAAFFKDKLTSIPNGVLDDLTVDCTTVTATSTIVVVTFKSNPGNLEPITIVRSAGKAATKNNQDGTTCAIAAITLAYGATIEGNYEESTCSNRGVCDYGTGLCKCFKGYTTDDCSVQNALAQ
jgi:hypothetical protein